MNKIFLILVSAIFPVAAVHAQVQVAPPETGASAGVQGNSQQATPSKSESWRSAHGRGGRAQTSSSVVAPHGTAHPTDPKSSSAAPQVNRPRDPQ